MIRPLPLMPLVFALSVASCQKEREQETTVTPGKEQPAKAQVAEVSIASVSLYEDCPEADPKAAADDNRTRIDSEAGGMAPGGAADLQQGYGMPCSQSSMQIAITGQGEASSTFRITALRLLGPKGETLSEMQPRMPMIWKADGYAAWDQTILPKTDIKASYKLSSPDWGQVQEKLGSGSYGPLFRLEAELKIDDVSKTIRSSETTRQRIEMIDT
jgi:hypothetical protein